MHSVNYYSALVRCKDVQHVSSFMTLDLQICALFFFFCRHRYVHSVIFRCTICDHKVFAGEQSGATKKAVEEPRLATLLVLVDARR